MATLHEARTREEVERIRRLFAEYARDVDAACCFAGFEQELAALPEPYFTLILATQDGVDAGCVAVRRLDRNTAEIKRLYVRSAYRGRGLGRGLALRAIAAARPAGCSRVVLDTLPTMHEAIALYHGLGFREVPPYLERPTPGAKCFALEL
jgi:ribosomal protein S18 acetylase RimI-like enzyme